MGFPDYGGKIIAAFVLAGTWGALPRPTRLEAGTDCAEFCPH